MRALILPIALLSMVGFAVSTACTAQLSAAPVTFAAYGSCDNAAGYAIVTGDYADYCGPDLSCPGDYYALCDGTAWNSCACDIPSGYTVVITSPDWGGGYGDDLGDGGSTTGEGGTPDGGNGDGSSTGDGSAGSGDDGSGGSGDDSGSGDTGTGSGDDGGAGGGG
jgi:hypothetical protein